MLPVMLRRDRERWGMSVVEVGWRFGITRREYIALEEGTAKPSSDTYDRICELYGWPGLRRIGGYSRAQYGTGVSPTVVSPRLVHVTGAGSSRVRHRRR
jgi:hypothetical protein